MLPLVLRGLRELVTVPVCGLCLQAHGPGGDRQLPCDQCIARLQLPLSGLQGSTPLPWWSLGSYEGALRHLLLQQRRTPQPATLQTLARSLRLTLPNSFALAVVVAIPSWKERGSNPLPQQLVLGLGLPSIQPLRRRHPTLGQHHLNRTLRALNQADAFTTRPEAQDLARAWRGRPLLLVDDILTTGATATAAAQTLREGGFQVCGLLCLARTPAPGRDLRSSRAASAAGRDSSVGRAGD